MTTVTQADLDALFDAIGDDYARWLPAPNATRDAAIARFRAGLGCDLGAAKKYARVTTEGSAWGFIVLTDADPRFPVGSILKTASWAKPALNKPRGNVITRDFSWVNWTGPAYLR